MEKLFGTDGIRSEAGKFPLDEATVRVAGRSLATQLARHLARAARIVVGRDTRESGEWIEGAFLAGARSAGATCESAGIITTPGVAFLARTLPADAGVVFSASHNPYQDNGIKIFAANGRKLDDATERLIEADIAAAKQNSQSSRYFDEQVSSNETSERRGGHLRELYVDYLSNEIAADLKLEGLTIVVDCANGAAYELAPAVFSRLGARVIAIGNAPDGRNINRGSGSLHMETLQRRVVEEGASLGVAFDGDADRALFVDARGRLVDGDATLWVLAKLMSDRGELAGKTVVATVMSNIGLELALRNRGIHLLRTDVGDKYVLEELLRTETSLGGEQSGHIIFPQISLAGDGVITAVQLLRAMRETSLHLHEMVAGFERYPQVLINVKVREKRPFDELDEVTTVARGIEARLEGRGRLLLRYSGTEPLARVMIEGERQDEIETMASDLASVISQTIGER
jgi:phosphoglucosamine mutase